MAKNTKHIEVDGCIINVRTGLHDSEGREVTSVEILCDAYAGDSWSLADQGNAKGINIRVVKDIAQG
jgi:hypothetical protein